MISREILSDIGLLFLLLLVSAVTGKAEEIPVDGGNETRLFFGLFTKSTTPSTVVLPFERTCSCSCGEMNVGTRIVGGVVTKPNEYPWMARLTYFNRFYCAGALINDRYVLSAAHCVKGLLWFMIKVTFGEHEICNSTLKPESRFVLRAIQGKFKYLDFENDISLLRLNDRVPFTDTIRPICLPKDATELYSGRLATVTGWGTLKEEGETSCSLQKVNLPVLTNAECKATNYSSAVIADSMMCAGYKEGGKDSCQGDSGGPLVLQRNDMKYELIGIVSWGNGCARPGYPGIYTRVTKYLNWIIENSADGCYCSD